MVIMEALPYGDRLLRHAAVAGITWACERRAISLEYTVRSYGRSSRLSEDRDKFQPILKSCDAARCRAERSRALFSLAA